MSELTICSGPCRPRQAWEASDGAVYLLRQLAEVSPQEALPFLASLAGIARLNHFPQARNLQETIWKQLGPVMLALGKRVSYACACACMLCVNVCQNKELHKCS